MSRSHPNTVACNTLGAHGRPIYVESKALLARNKHLYVHWCAECGAMFGAAQILDPEIQSLMGARQPATSAEAGS